MELEDIVAKNFSDLLWRHRILQAHSIHVAVEMRSGVDRAGWLWIGRVVRTASHRRSVRVRERRLRRHCRLRVGSVVGILEEDGIYGLLMSL